LADTKISNLIDGGNIQVTDNIPVERSLQNRRVRLTSSVIKAIYESNSDTNAFTDAEQTKVANSIQKDGSVAMTDAFDEAQGSDIASAATINLETATGNVVDVTGTTAITAVTLNQGHRRIVRFTGILTLTNGASLVLPSGANIITAAGDYAEFTGYASSVVRVSSYIKADGTPIVGGGGGGHIIQEEGSGLTQRANLNFVGAAITATDGGAGPDSTIVTVNAESGATANDTDANLKARANHTGTQLASTISDFDTEVSNNSSVSANTSKVTNATHTGDVTGDVALTISNGAVTDLKIPIDEISFNKLIFSTGSSRLIGRNSTGGAGSFQEIQIGPGILMDGITLKGDSTFKFTVNAIDLVNLSIGLSSQIYSNSSGPTGFGQITATLDVSDTFNFGGKTFTSTDNGDRIILSGELGFLGGDANGIFSITIAGTALTLDRTEDYFSTQKFGTILLVQEGEFSDQLFSLISPNTNTVTIGGASGDSLTFARLTNRQNEFPTTQTTGSVTINYAFTSSFRLPLTGNADIQEPLNTFSGHIYYLRIIQDVTGGRVVTFNSKFKNVPVIRTGSNEETILMFYVDNNLDLVQLDTNSIENIVEDTTPQLGGNLDTNANNIDFDDSTGIRDDSGNEHLIFGKTASAVNNSKITNAATGNDPIFEAEGDDTNVGIKYRSKGTGQHDFENKQVVGGSFGSRTVTTATTIVGTDGGAIIYANPSSAIDITLPETSTETLPVGFATNIINIGTDDITLVTEGTDTFNGNDTIKPGQASVITKRIAGSPNTFRGIGGNSTTTENISIFVETVANKDYRFHINIGFAGTITRVTTISISGTCTATTKINTTALGGTANSVSSSENEQIHSTSNEFVVGDDILTTISANSSCLDMMITIEYTRDA